MKKLFLFAGCWILASACFGQTVSDKLQTAFRQFEADSQLRHAIASLYVIDAATGAVVFDKNSQVGLAPASTQKVITSVTAFELLGKDFKYPTSFGFKAGNSITTLYVSPSGDPTFGSWRWKETSGDTILKNLMSALDRRKVRTIRNVIIDNSKWDFESIPDGWIWQDIGNYYGAGAHKLNYHENQYDIILKSGSAIGDSVAIVSSGSRINLSSRLTSAAKNTGDNAYVYLPDGYSRVHKIRGTIPVNENKFSISASSTEPEWSFMDLLLYRLQEEKGFEIIHGQGIVTNDSNAAILTGRDDVIFTHYSPSLDSIIYWFNRKSINLYGEALIKTFAFQKTGIASTDSGTAIVRKFWKDKGLDEDELNVYDGSGLSPLNRVTTHAQVEILKYAKTKEWYPYFFESLPEYNGMKIKSGTISDVKGFCGYHKAKNGKEYIFSFLINNYSGRSAQLVSKMYKVLDVLK